MSVLLVPCKFLVRSTTCCIRAILLRTRGGGFLHGHVGKYTQGVSATPPPRWTITPLFYSRSTDLPVLRGRRRVDGDDARRRTELHYSVDALRGVVFARRQSGDVDGAKAAARTYAAAGGDLNDIDEESDDDDSGDLTEFEVKAERLEGVDDDDLYNKMSQEEPLECSGGPLLYNEREPDAPGTVRVFRPYIVVIVNETVLLLVVLRLIRTRRRPCRASDRRVQDAVVAIVIIIRQRRPWRRRRRLIPSRTPRPSEANRQSVPQRQLTPPPLAR